jgi:hypothetical protein
VYDSAASNQGAAADSCSFCGLKLGKSSSVSSSSGGGGSGSSSSSAAPGWLQALDHRDKLLQFEANRAARTVVIDDQGDNVTFIALTAVCGLVFRV